MGKLALAGAVGHMLSVSRLVYSSQTGIPTVKILGCAINVSSACKQLSSKMTLQ